MQFFNTILILIFALTRAIHAAPPTDGGYRDTSDPSTFDLDYFCGHIYKEVYSRYILRGRKWNFSESQIKKAVKKTSGCAMTVWRYREVEEEGRNSFDVTFHLPILCVSKLEKSLNKLVGPTDQGIKCPSIPETEETKRLHQELGPQPSEDDQ